MHGFAFRGPVCLFLSASVFSVLLPGADDAPKWLKEAASASVPSYDKEVPAVVLIGERRVTVDDAGDQKSETRRVLRILKQAGNKHAVAAAAYQAGQERNHEMTAWLILPSGKVQKYGKKETLDMAVADDVYSEVRMKLISAADAAEPGSVFGYEILVEEAPLFNQLEWPFQTRIPALQSTMTLELPPRWRVESTTFNHAAVRPDVVGNRHRWELRDLPFLKDEPASPSLEQIVPRIGISYFPPAESGRTRGRAFGSWAEVSSWLADLNDPRAAPGGPITSEVAGLTRGLKTEPDKIKAIARYVQDVRYVSIQTGLGRGGGYLPRPAADVFAQSYGDCKDKSALMRAMLQSAGIRSYAVALYASDPHHVTEEWPTPQQFNHVIVAIAVPEGFPSSMTVVHPEFGRLLFFDPTDPDTNCGDLPADEQGSLALLAAARGGGLVRLPSSAADANRREREIEATLDGAGAIKVRMREQAIGQTAASFRRVLRSNPGSKYRQMMESWIAGDVTGAHLAKVESASRNDGFELDIEFAAERYGHLMQQRLLVFRPAIVSQRNNLSLTEPERTQPLKLEAHAFAEKTTFFIPQGFAVDELPEPVELETPFGSYSTKSETRQSGLLFTRKLVLNRSTVAPNQYSALRKFFDAIRAAEQAPVVLIRK